MNNNKLWLTLITQEREKDIDELTKDTYDYFDGIVAVVNQPSNDKTYEILDSRKKAGKIIKRPFVKHHAHMMNEFLFSGVIKNLDWFLILDSPERINLNWLKGLREDIFYYEKNNIGGLFLDRIYLARYIDSMEFNGGVHWGLSPFIGNIVNACSITGYKKTNYISSTRNSLDSGVLNPAKYYFSYGANSQTQLLYQQFGNDVWQRHENMRMVFRINCQNKLGLDLTLDSLIQYMVNNVNNFPSWFEEMLEIEVNLIDIFRLKVLNHTVEDLVKNRFNWSYYKWKNEGLINQDINNGYIGIFNKYLNRIGRPQQ